MHKYLIVILGPTGIGKTDAAVAIAEKTGSEIISCDSRQFFREMKIGTAVPSDAILKRVKHHFVRFLDAGTYYSSNRFAADVLNLLPDLFSKNSFAVMAGGSGLYIDAVCSGTDDIPDTDPAIRQKYSDLYKKEGIEALRIALKILDPVHYRAVDLKNPKRLLRALEVTESTGLPYSSFLKKGKQQRDFTAIKIGLNRPREEMYARIDARVDQMLNDGLEEEARSLFHLKSLNALDTVGYKELFGYFEGLYSREEAVRLIKRNTRRYAKRQLTWWARDTEIKWFHPCDTEAILNYILSASRSADQA